MEKLLGRISQLALLLLGSVLACVLAVQMLSKPTPQTAHDYLERQENISQVVPGVDWKGNGRTLILALSTTYKYKSKYMRLWRQVTSEAVGEAKIVAVSPEPAEEAERYLTSQGIHVDQVEQLPVSAFGVVVPPVAMMSAKLANQASPSASSVLADAALPIMLLVNGAGEVVGPGARFMQPEKMLWLLTGLRTEEERKGRLADPSTQAAIGTGPGAKTVEIYPQHSTDPIEVVRVNEGGKLVVPGRWQGPEIPGVRFQAGDEWLYGLSFVLRNRTDKNIAYVRIFLIFPEAGPRDREGLQVSREFVLGRIPDNAAYTPEGEKIPQGNAQPLAWGPGQQMTVSLSPYAGEIRRAIEAYEYKPFSTFTKCVFGVGLVYLPDGMQWGNHGFGYATPDPTHPGNSVPIVGSAYFPGDKDQPFWP